MVALSTGTRCFVGMCLAVAAAGVAAQSSPAPANVVALEASGEVEVAQDWVSITLAATREGADAATVQGALKDDVSRALEVAHRGGAGEGEALQVQTSGFSLYPRASQDGKPMTWQGTAGIVLQGTDVAAVSALAGRIPGLAVRQVAFGLSPQARAQAGDQARRAAIRQFRARAAEITREFGFGSYTLGEVRVGEASGAPGQPRPMVAMAMRADAAAPVPAEAGRSTVSVTVSGSVQMR